MDFAVTVKGQPAGTAQWVLAVDGERLLLVRDDRSLEWVAMADCTFAKAAGPDQPRLVMAVQPQQGPGLAVPKLVKGNHG